MRRRKRKKRTTVAYFSSNREFINLSMLGDEFTLRRPDRRRVVQHVVFLRIAFDDRTTNEIDVQFLGNAR